MYEILEVSPNASYSEIKAAYQRLNEKLHSERSEQNGDDIDFRLKVVNFAFHTLSVPLSRDAYDAQLAPLKPSENIVAPGNVIALKPNIDAIYLRSDAASLRADAASLRADALLLRADALMLKTSNSTVEQNEDSIFAKIKSSFSSLTSPLKKILLIFGTLMAMWMVLQVVFLLFASRQSNLAAAETSKAEEKIYIQEYYQQTGIRVGSKAEADLIEAEKRRKENDQRSAERELKKQEEDSRRFAEESRRIGERVSENLRQDEARARQEEERRQDKLEQEKRREEMAEINRIEREKARWKSNSYQSPSYNSYDSSN